MYPEIITSSASLDNRLRPDVLETSLVRRPAFDRDGSRVFAKLENTQHTGSFKLRGATAKLKSLTSEQLASGVVTASTGNHGAAVARAAAQSGTAVEVFVSTEADASKVAAIQDLGAAIRTIPGDPVNAEAAAREEAERTGKTYVPPYNDATVIAGQGTIGVELIRQTEPPAAVVVSVGGGGLISGIAATLRHHWPTTRIIGASAANSAAMHHSVAAGSIIEVEHYETLSDGTAGGIEACSMTFEMCRALVSDWHLVTEDEIAAALRAYMSNYPDRIEGSAGVALAALDHTDLAGSVVVVICGGNVADATLATIGMDG
jgi:threonine dehydratase